MQYQTSLDFDAQRRNTPVLYDLAPKNDHLPGRSMDPIANDRSHAHSQLPTATDPSMASM